MAWRAYFVEGSRCSLLKAKCYILRRDPVGRHATMQAKQCVHMCGRGCILVFALQQYTWTVYMNDEHLLLDYTQTEACTAHSMDSFMHEQLYIHGFLPSLRSPSIPHYYCFFWGWCWQTFCTTKLGQRVAAGKKKKKKDGETEKGREEGEEEKRR